MLHAHSYRLVFTVLMTALAGLIVIISTMRAQDRNRNLPQGDRAPSVRPFGGRGSERRAEGLKPPPAPHPLSKLALQGVMKSLGKVQPGSIYVNLRPSQPTVADRGALVFVGANVVEGGNNYALYGTDVVDSNPKPAQGYVVLWLKSPANRSYLIDCAVSGATLKHYKKFYEELGKWHEGVTSEGASFDVTGPDGTTQTTNFTGEQHELLGDHVLFPLNATNAGWYGFQITGHATVWAIYWCEVTNL